MVRILAHVQDYAIVELRKGSGSTGSDIVGILIIGVAKEGKLWAEGPYLHAFANLGRPPFSSLALVLILLVALAFGGSLLAVKLS